MLCGAATYRHALDGSLPGWNVQTVLAQIPEIVGEDAEDEGCNQQLQHPHHGGDAARHERELRHDGRRGRRRRDGLRRTNFRAGARKAGRSTMSTRGLTERRGGERVVNVLYGLGGAELGEKTKGRYVMMERNSKARLRVGKGRNPQRRRSCFTFHRHSAYCQVIAVPSYYVTDNTDTWWQSALHHTTQAFKVAHSQIGLWPQPSPFSNPPPQRHKHLT